MERLLNIADAHYKLDPVTKVNVNIIARIDGIETVVPFDLANTTYAEIMRQVEAGELTIADAE